MDLGRTRQELQQNGALLAQKSGGRRVETVNVSKT